MRVRVARVRPTLLIIGVGLAGPAALAFDFTENRSSSVKSPVFPAFIDATRFAELAAAHKAWLARGDGKPAMFAPAAETRLRAEELGWGLHAPAGAEAPIAIAEPATDASAAWEAAARRAADELAREQERTAKTQTAAPTVGPPPGANASAEPAPAANGEVKTIGKLDSATAAKPPAVDPKGTKPVSAPRQDKPVPSAGTAKAVPPPKQQSQLAPPSALGAIINLVEKPSWRAKAIPKEPSAFGWDNTAN